MPFRSLPATIQDARDMVDTMVDEVEEAVDGFKGPVRHCNCDSRLLGQFGKTCVDLDTLTDL